MPSLPLYSLLRAAVIPLSEMAPPPHSESPVIVSSEPINSVDPVFLSPPPPRRQGSPTPSW